MHGSTSCIHEPVALPPHPTIGLKIEKQSTNPRMRTSSSLLPPPSLLVYDGGSEVSPFSPASHHNGHVSESTSLSMPLRGADYNPEAFLYMGRTIGGRMHDPTSPQSSPSQEPVQLPPFTMSGLKKKRRSPNLSIREPHSRADSVEPCESTSEFSSGETTIEDEIFEEWLQTPHQPQPELHQPRRYDDPHLSSPCPSLYIRPHVSNSYPIWRYVTASNDLNPPQNTPEQVAKQPQVHTTNAVNFSESTSSPSSMQGLTRPVLLPMPPTIGLKEEKRPIMQTLIRKPSARVESRKPASEISNGD
jgi:hypothetical protein